MLQSVTLRDFKSFVDERARIAPFTLLVGANATGKSNFLDALRLLHGMAQGWSVRDVVAGRFEGSTKVWPGIRGGGGELVRVGASTASLACEWLLSGDVYQHGVEFDGTTVVREFLDVQDAGSGPARRLFEVQNSEQSVLGTQPSAAAPLIGHLRATLAGVHFAEQRPSLMRDYVEKPRGAARIRPSTSGDNLSGVLWQLCQDAGARQELVDWLVELCAPEIADIEFEETESGYVMLRIVERDGTHVTARSMSDGTLRFLGLLAALRSPLATIVIEDLEHGLHPSRLQLLVDAIQARTTPPPSAKVVIATTHSPALVEAALAIPDSAVLLFARIPGVEGTVIRDVRSLPNFEEVHRRRDFAYLINTGWLERAV